MGRTATKRKRKEVEYERSVPRCANCISYQGPVLVTNNGVKAYQMPFCRHNEFSVDMNGCCNKWEGKDGTVLLEAEEE